ncbi:pre-toxin TG domain-containing protein [Rummeliibacillus sp. TYF-LIM-RU47]|uniref:pre-toxin TG domain-containing protein n=1 Tax=Rummeliibacillus sp. TYF-LIM-RU47 TaxID=2608406 RepID=UPI00123A0F40|nr:pre-toxin TG domain-containing protein [Rummeliibacillus sp. TYF-LIM-RU47]
MKLLYEADKWSKVASALEKVNEAHKYDNKYEKSDDLFKDSKAEISEKDIDHAISFKPKTYEPEAKPIRQDYKKLYDYAKGIGKVIDEKVDDPFYRSIDRYIQSMADLNISSYNTTNTIHVEEGWLFKTDKTSITIDDLYEADTTYSENLKEEYNQWKLQNKDQEDVSEEDYRTAALNTGAFEYEGLRAGQEKKEFWFNLIAAGLVIGLTIVCPPAGLVAGGIYTAVDVGGAIIGEDLISGRKLSDDERIMRGVFAIAPAAGGLAIRTTLKNVPALANVVVKTSKALDKAAKPIKNSVDNLALKTKQTAANAIRNANHLGRQHANQLKYMLKHPVNAAVTSKAGETTIKKSAKFIDEALRPVHIKTVQTTTGEKVVAGLQRGENTGEVSKKADDYVARMKADKEITSVKNENLKFEHVGEYFDHINEIGKRNDLTKEEKLQRIHKAYDALGDTKGDITVVSNTKYLMNEAFDSDTGRMLIDWPPKMGFIEDSMQPINRSNPLPEQWDRIGGKGGENFTIVPKNGVPYSYDQRAIPYLDNPTARHTGQFKNDLYFKAIDAIKDGNLEDLNQILKMNDKLPLTITDFKIISSYYKDSIENLKNSFGDLDVTYGLKGNAAPWINSNTGKKLMEGGADQIVTPLSGTILEKIGIIPAY